MRKYYETLAELLNKAFNSFPVPAKYSHNLIISTELFIKLWSMEIIDFAYYGIDNIIHYQARNEIMMLSFTTTKACNEVQIKILEYIIKEKAGSVPVLRVDNKKKQIKNSIINGSRSE